MPTKVTVESERWTLPKLGRELESWKLVRNSMRKRQFKRRSHRKIHFYLMTLKFTGYAGELIHKAYRARAPVFSFNEPRFIKLLTLGLGTPPLVHI